MFQTIFFVSLLKQILLLNLIIFALWFHVLDQGLNIWIFLFCSTIGWIILASVSLPVGRGPLMGRGHLLLGRQNLCYTSLLF